MNLANTTNKKAKSCKRSLLLGDTEGLSASTSGLGSLSSDSNTPVMSKTSMLLGFSHSLEIHSHFGIKLIGNKLGIVSGSWISLSVKEPFWNVVVGWSDENVIDGLGLFVSDLTSSLINIDLGNLENQESESSTDTSDLSETEWYLLFTVQVGVQNTKNVLEVVWI